MIWCRIRDFHITKHSVIYLISNPEALHCLSLCDRHWAAVFQNHFTSILPQLALRLDSRVDCIGVLRLSGLLLKNHAWMGNYHTLLVLLHCADFYFWASCQKALDGVIIVVNSIADVKRSKSATATRKTLKTLYKYQTKSHLASRLNLSLPT